MLKSVFEFLGSPDEADLSFITDEQAKSYVKKFKKRLTVDPCMRFPNISKDGLDLMRQMLAFNPILRLSVDQCLNHPFFDEVRSDHQHLESSV